MQEVTVRIPASTSNLGPGFDCLGVALRIYSQVALRRGGRRSGSPIVREAAESFFARAQIRSFAFSCKTHGEVPVSRGLGSSATIRLGLLHGLNTLAGQPLRRGEIFALCAELEGHPDNAAAAEFGGFNVIRTGSRQRFAVSAALKFVLLVPSFEVSTATARALLPDQISRDGAVESCGNAAAIAAAFVSGKYRYLRGVFRDHLHQPFRKKLVPFFDDVIAAAEHAGALGGFLSGSGSTIVAVTLRGPQKVAAAMLSAASPGSPGVNAVGYNNARIVITTADNRGAHVLPIRNQESEIRNSAP